MCSLAIFAVVVAADLAYAQSSGTLDSGGGNTNVWGGFGNINIGIDANGNMTVGTGTGGTTSVTNPCATDPASAACTNATDPSAVQRAQDCAANPNPTNPACSDPAAPTTPATPVDPCTTDPSGAACLAKQADAQKCAEDPNPTNPYCSGTSNGTHTASGNPGSQLSSLDYNKRNELERKTRDNWTKGFQDMTRELVVMGLHQVFQIGVLIDGKNMLERQLWLKTKQAEAHRDYKPSEFMCRYGTNIRCLAASQEKSRANATAFNEIMLRRELNNVNRYGSYGEHFEMRSRLARYKNIYCDPSDSNGAWGDPAGEISKLCNSTDLQRRNNDIDYGKVLDTKLTLDVDFLNDQNIFVPPPPAIPTRIYHENPSQEEEDLIALSTNLFAYKRIPVIETELLTRKSADAAESDPFNMGAVELLQDSRGITAARSIARNSFSKIIGMKSRGSCFKCTNAEFLKAYLRELVPLNEWPHGSQLPKTDKWPPGDPRFQTADATTGDQVDKPFVWTEEAIDAYLGENPSYHAQMELLTKRVALSPHFIGDLYTSPANVQRRRVLMTSLEMMQDRDILESLQRRELLLATYLELKLRQIEADLENGIY